jgi:hypothetical protein
MRRISSSWTCFYKRIFPVIWFGFLALFVGFSVFAGQRSLPFLIVPLGMIGLGYFLMKKLVFGLVDEIWADGHALVVKNGGRDERIAFTDIKNVNYSPFVNRHTSPCHCDGRRASAIKSRSARRCALYR